MISIYILSQTDETIHSVNILLPTLRRAYDFLHLNQSHNPTATLTPSLTLELDTADDEQRYSLPVAREVAALIPRNAPPEASSLDVCLYLRMGAKRTRVIPSHHPLHWPLVYPLLFPYGDRAWGPDLNMNRTPDARDVAENVAVNVVNDDTPDDDQEPGEPHEAQDDGNSRITERTFWRYHLQIRDRIQSPDGYIRPWCNPLLAGGFLYHQLIVHIWSSILLNVLNWYRYNNDQFRDDDVSAASNGMTELTAQTQAHEHQGDRPLHADIGRKTILPQSFLGGDRYMRRLLYDMMNIVGKFGSPSFFITFTANPAWPEITDNLSRFQKPSDRPDFISRVFRLKLKSLLDDLKAGALGRMLQMDGWSNTKKGATFTPT